MAVERCLLSFGNESPEELLKISTCDYEVLFNVSSWVDNGGERRI